MRGSKTDTPCGRTPVAGELRSLAGIIRHYHVHHERGLDDYLRWYRDLPCLDDAVCFAALALTPEGRKHPHARRIENAALDAAARTLEAVPFCEIRTFHDLYLAVRAAIDPIPRIGSVTVYDTSLRIGAFLCLSPDRVYVHAGAKVGAAALGLDAHGEWLKTLGPYRELHVLEAHHVENLLCIYKKHLAPFRREA